MSNPMLKNLICSEQHDIHSQEKILNFSFKFSNRKESEWKLVLKNSKDHKISMSK